jgi:predicted nucleic acid-binding protein
MKTCFVDTNLFIRYFTNNDPYKADRVERLLLNRVNVLFNTYRI